MQLNFSDPIMLTDHHLYIFSSEYNPDHLVLLFVYTNRHACVIYMLAYTDGRFSELNSEFGLT